MKLRPLFAILAALLAGLVVLPARGQEQSPFTIEVRAGYDGEGRYRVGHWFPASIVVANDGPDTAGTLVWSFPGDSEGSFQYELDLPRGARKAITLPVVTGGDSRSARVTLTANGAELARIPVRLAPIRPEDLAVGVISSDRALLNSLATATVAPNTPTSVTNLDQAMLPEDPSLLAGLDTIFVHDLATAELSERQREALALWTRLGGQLIVGGGPRADQTTPGLAELLPVEVGELQAEVATDTLGALASRGDLADSLPATTANAVTPREGASSLDGAGLLTAWDAGAGQVVFAAFDLAALRTWGGEAELWAEVLRAEPRMTMGASLRWRSENILGDALELPALQLPSTSLLLCLMAFYIVVVGPVNFLVLRRLKRVELAWVTTPLLVVLFSAAAYGASFALRGTRAQTTGLAIVQGFEGYPGGQATAFEGIFSPQRRSYRVDFGARALVTPGTFESFQLQSEAVTTDGVTTGMRDLLIDVSALRTLLVEEPAARVPEASSDLVIDRGRGVSGQLRLGGSIGLRDAMVVLADSAQELGDLEPGSAVTVNLRSSARNFPDQVSPTTGGIINRGQVLNNLFSYDRFARGGPTFQGAKGLPELDGVYLLGWVEAAGVGTTLDGVVAPSQSETLYIIRLDS